MQLQALEHQRTVNYEEIIDKDDGSVVYGEYTVNPVVTESELVEAYQQFKTDNILEQIFTEQAPDLVPFINTFRELPVLTCRFKGRLCGLGWLSRAKRFSVWTVAEAGASFFRHSGADLTILGAMLLHYGFSTLNLETILATTPEPNKPMVHFFERIGFEPVGVIPNFTLYEGKLCGAKLAAVTREQWFKLIGKEGNFGPKN